MGVALPTAPVDPAGADLVSNGRESCIGCTALRMIPGEAGICMPTAVSA